MKIERFEDLEIWQEARELCNLIYRETNNSPFIRDLKFRDQILRASGSVMDNIAEGFGRGGNKEFIFFLSISKGSNDEVRSQIFRAFDFHYIDEQTFEDLLERSIRISRKISNLIMHLNKSEFKGPRYTQQ